MNDEGIRLVGDVISEEEWIDPVVNRTDLPISPRNEMPNALNLIASAGLENDHRHTIYSISISESEFMRFNLDNDGSPGKRTIYPRLSTDFFEPCLCECISEGAGRQLNCV